MLVLSRKPGEKITLINRATGEKILLTQVRIGPNTSRIGIDAENHWEIYRNELEPDAVTENTDDSETDDSHTDINCTSPTTEKVVTH